MQIEYRGDGSFNLCQGGGWLGILASYVSADMYYFLVDMLVA